MCDDEALAKIAELEAEVQRLQASLAYADSLVEQARRAGSQSKSVAEYGSTLRAASSVAEGKTDTPSRVTPTQQTGESASRLGESESFTSKANVAATARAAATKRSGNHERRVP